MNDRWILLDRETGLHVGWYFWLRVLDEVNRSSRYGSPFGLVMMEAELDPGTPRRALDEASGRVPAAIRGTDLGGLLGPGRVGLMLTQQDLESAIVATQRVRERLERDGVPGVTWRLRLYTYPEQAAEISQLLTGATPESEQALTA